MIYHMAMLERYIVLYHFMKGDFKKELNKELVYINGIKMNIMLEILLIIECMVKVCW